MYRDVGQSVDRTSLTSLISHLCETWKPGALFLAPSASPKTITVRHWETPEREVGRSECPVVMTGIAVGRLTAKAELTSNWCFVARNLYRIGELRKANERGFYPSCAPQNLKC